MLKMKEKFSIVYLKSKQLAVHIDVYGRRTGLSRSSITKHLKQVQQVGFGGSYQTEQKPKLRYRFKI